MNDKMYRQNGAFANMVPRQTVIGNQPHMLAYINPSEEQLLQEYRNDAPVLAGPDGVPSYAIFGYDSVSDMFDGGGPGKSGAQFSGAGAANLDTDNDNYISQAEYSAGKSASEANKNNSISNAYDNKDNFISGISNSIGALPRGSIVAEATRGGNMDTMKTTSLVNYLQGGGMPGAVIRGIKGAAGGMGIDLTPQPVQDFAGQFGRAAGDMGRALTGQGNLTAAQEQERLAKSTNSIFNQGGKAPPQDVIDAYKRQNPRAFPRAFRQNDNSIGAVTRFMDESPEAKETKTETSEPNYVFDPVTGNFEVIGPSGEVLYRIPASDLNMQN